MLSPIEFWKTTQVPETPHSYSPLSLAQGTLIACEDGAMAVESIKAGDIVNTLSDGPQVVRWVGASPADTRDYIQIEPGALGPNTPAHPLRVTPRHRLMLINWKAEMLFGSHKVMIEAKSLVNDNDIKLISPKAPQSFYHILFDNHEIISANNTPCESFLTTKTTLGTLPQATREKIKSQLSNPPTPLSLPTITTAEAALLH